MKLEKLVELVKLMYMKIYNEDVLKVLKENEDKYILNFKNEKIIVDNSTGSKYRITFEDYVKTNLEFRNLIDEALGFNMFCCDWSYFLDLQASYIDKIYKYVS